MSYLNPVSIEAAYIDLIKLNAANIQRIVDQFYGAGNRNMIAHHGDQEVLLEGSTPCIEVEATESSNEWFAVRTIKASYNVKFTITVCQPKADEAKVFIKTLSQSIKNYLTQPMNLQLIIPSEYAWQLGANTTTGVKSYDTENSSLSYESAEEGCIWRSEFTLTPVFALPYAEDMFTKTCNMAGVDLSVPIPIVKTTVI